MPLPLDRPEQLRELLGIPFTPEQLACVAAPLAPGVIVAGAGSGKTTVMAARVVWLVGTGQVAPDQVLGLTFTNKAAAELSERVRRALARAGVAGGQGGGPQPVGQAGGRGVGPGGARGGASRGVPGGVLGDEEPAGPSGAGRGPFGAGRSGAAAGPRGLEPEGAEAPGDPQISTYHAFAGQLLKDHGMRIGLEPSARLLADATRFQLAAKVLRAAPGPYPALTKGLPTLVADLLALAGELSEHLVEPERLREFDGELAEVLGGLDPGRRGFAWVKEVAPAVAARRELAELAAVYGREKERRDLLDFGDQIALSARLAQSRKEVGAALREQYAVVLLDEYQDTSVAQRLLLAGLFGGGTGHPVTAVGDPCQAIYGWRGASVANLDDFPRHFPNRDGRPADRYALSENRRSGGRLLELANSLAAELRARHEGVEALRPAPGAERDGVVRCALLPTQEEETAWLGDAVAHLVRTGTPPGEIAVLCRTAAHFADIHAALVAREVPVEVVGLSGLLHLPEVADLVATCEVLHDPTANASLVRLLTGPRWRIGPRDLALLGRRARLLVRHEGPGAAEVDRLAAAVEGVDPAEVVSLADALESFMDAEPPDDLPFSPQARVRFARLAAEIRELRRALGDPLMDVLHRVLAVTGLEVELSASPHALAARRRETLHAFLDVAASFAALDGETTLLAFLGFLRTAAQYEKGLDGSLPGGENTVKVLTAHKSKGLEWDVVVVPGLVAKGFPSERGRELWPTSSKVLPHRLRGDAATLPDVTEWTKAGLDGFKADMKEHQRIEELRLGYVTFTRPRSLLLGSGHWWGPTQTKPFGPSTFLEALRAHCEAGHGEVEAWAERPEEGAENPALASAIEPQWPLPLDPVALERRREAARKVREAIEAARTTALFPGASGVSGTPGASGAPGAPGESGALGTAGPSGTSGPPAMSGALGAERGGAAVTGRAGGAGGAGEVGEVGEVAGVGEQRTPAASGASGGLGDLAGTAGEGSVPRQGGSGEAEGEAEDGGLVAEEARVVAAWDRDLRALTGELRRARAGVREVPLPRSLTATQLMRLAEDPDGLAEELARPLPRPPAPAARRGTRFHAWVESRFEVRPLFPPEELPGIEPGDDIADEQDLAALKEAFLRTPYAERHPYRVEAPFNLALAGRLIRGRIDAVYRTVAGGVETYEIVDWKTGRTPNSADPLQLAIYRLAWAEQQGVPLGRVTAAFVHVRTGRVVRPAPLPDRVALEALLPPDGPNAPHPFDGPGGREAVGGSYVPGGSKAPGPPDAQDEWDEPAEWDEWDEPAGPDEPYDFGEPPEPEEPYEPDEPYGPGGDEEPYAPGR